MFARRMITGLCSLILLGCAGQVTEYRPHAVDPGVMQGVKSYEAAYNRADWKSIADLFHEDGLIVVEKEDAGLFSHREFRKKQFQEVFPQTAKRFPLMTLGEPYVHIILDSKDKAVMELTSRFGDQKIPTKFSFMLVQGRWQIWKIRYH